MNQTTHISATADRPPSVACDTHVHVFDPAGHAYAPARSYTPPPATVGDLQAHLQRTGMQRVVLVQPSVYGSDNRCLVAALHALGPCARGVAVLPEEGLPTSHLEAMHQAGVRGIRLNLHAHSTALAAAQAQMQQHAPLLRALGWSLQLHATLPVLMALMESALRMQVPLVLDHFAGGVDGSPAAQSLLDGLLAHMRNAPIFVKLSAPYRLPTQNGAFTDAQLAQRLYQAAPDQVVWGSDWPHTGGTGVREKTKEAIEPFRTVDTPQNLQRLLSALPDATARHRLLTSNPARLYGFCA